MAEDLNFGINVTASGVDIVDQLRAKLSAVRAELSASATSAKQLVITKEQEEAAWKRASGSISLYNAEISKNMDQARIQSSQQLSQSIDKASTAYATLAANIDVESQEAVAAFKREGIALQDYMEHLGATAMEIQRITSAISVMEARAKGATILPGVPEATRNTQALTISMEQAEIEAHKMNDAMNQADQTITKVPLGARRGANALSSLAFSASLGTGNAKMMAIAMGSAVSGIAALTSSAQLAAAATGIGALITVLATVAILLDRDADNADKAAKSIHDLGKLNSEQQAILLQALDVQIERQMKATGFQAAMHEGAQKFMAQDFKTQMEGLKLLTTGGETAQKQLELLLKRREEILAQMVDTTGKEENAITDMLRKANEERLELETTRLKGTTAARVAAADFELAERRRELDKTAMNEQERAKLVEDAVAVRNEKVQAIEEADAKRLETLRRGWADEALSAFQRRTEDEFTAERLLVERKFAERQLDISREKISEEERTQLVATAAHARAEALATIDKTEKEKRLTERRDLEDKLLAITGHTADARAGRIEESYRKTIEDMIKRSDNAGIQIVNNLINVEKAAGRMQDLQQIIGESTTELTTKLSEIQALSSVHALSERDARQQTLDVYIKTRDVLAQTIPLLQEQADKIKSPAAREAVEAARLKLIELGVEIKKIGDDLYKLKEGAREAFESGIATFLDEAASGAKSFSEAWQDAARSIVDSLRKIAAQMLANLIMQKALEFLGGFSGGGSVGNTVTTVVEHAADGGYISGPGTPTSDSIPAMLSNGEYVLQASAVRRLGVGFLDDLNAVGSHGISSRRMARGYADGGIVTAGGNPDSSHTLNVGLEEGLVVRHLESSEGQKAQLRFIEKNATKIKRALG